MWTVDKRTGHPWEVAEVCVQKRWIRRRNEGIVHRVKEDFLQQEQGALSEHGA